MPSGYLVLLFYLLIYFSQVKPWHYGDMLLQNEKQQLSQSQLIPEFAQRLCEQRLLSFLTL